MAVIQRSDSDVWRPEITSNYYFQSEATFCNLLFLKGGHLYSHPTYRLRCCHCVCDVNVREWKVVRDINRWHNVLQCGIPAWTLSWWRIQIRDLQYVCVSMCLNVCPGNLDLLERNLESDVFMTGCYFARVSTRMQMLRTAESARANICIRALVSVCICLRSMSRCHAHTHTQTGTQL